MPCSPLLPHFRLFHDRQLRVCARPLPQEICSRSTACLNLIRTGLRPILLMSPSPTLDNTWGAAFVGVLAACV